METTAFHTNKKKVYFGRNCVETGRIVFTSSKNYRMMLVIQENVNFIHLLLKIHDYCTVRKSLTV